MDNVKVALGMALLLAAGIGLGVALSAEGPAPAEPSASPDAAASPAERSPGARSLAPVPEPFRRKLGLARASFVPGGWEEPPAPTCPRLPAREEALQEKFRTGNLSRLANGAVFVDPGAAARPGKKK